MTHPEWDVYHLTLVIAGEVSLCLSCVYLFVCLLHYNNPFQLYGYS